MLFANWQNLLGKQNECFSTENESVRLDQGYLEWKLGILDDRSEDFQINQQPLIGLSSFFKEMQDLQSKALIILCVACEFAKSVLKIYPGMDNKKLIPEEILSSPFDLGWSRMKRGYFRLQVWRFWKQVMILHWRWNSDLAKSSQGCHHFSKNGRHPI